MPALTFFPVYGHTLICHLDVLLEGEWIMSWLHISSLDQDFLPITEAHLFLL